MELLTTLPSVTLYGLALLAVGIGLRLAISKRRFDRRGYAGLQHFSNYWTGLLTTVLESLVAIVSALMIVSGAILIIVELYNGR